MNRDPETRARLLTAAERLFADRGFKKVTVRDICRAARANVAAVNYHFGDKLGLYHEVLRGVVAAMRTTTEAARRAAAGGPPADRLRRWIESAATRLLTNNDGRIYRLVQREVTDPTPALDDVIERGLRPRIDDVAALVAECIGMPASDPHVKRCVASIQTQVIAYLPNPIAARIGMPSHPTSAAEIAAAAAHIAEFSIGGVNALADNAKAAKAAKTAKGAKRAKKSVGR